VRQGERDERIFAEAIRRVWVVLPLIVLIVVIAYGVTR
jgi:hypothetical protein